MTRSTFAALAVAAGLALAVGTAGCATTPPGGAGAPATPPASTAPSTPSHSPAPTPTTATEVTPTPVGVPHCTPGQTKLVTTGASAAAATTAANLHRAAAACEVVTLRNLAVKDRTEVSFGGLTAQQVFDQEGGVRADALQKLLTLTPAVTKSPEGTTVTWPADPRTDADWKAIQDSGLYTAKELARIRAEGSGYGGWRIGIDAGTGRWLYFVAGD